jgi:hypothetical protein
MESNKPWLAVARKKYVHIDSRLIFGSPPRNPKKTTALAGKHAKTRE